MTGHDHWFEPIADHLGAAYLRYSFTKGTRQEVDAVVGWLGLRPGMRVSITVESLPETSFVVEA